MFNFFIKIINTKFLKKLGSVFIGNVYNFDYGAVFYKKCVSFNINFFSKITSYSTIFYITESYTELIWKNILFFCTKVFTLILKIQEYFFILEFKLVDLVICFFILNFFIFLIYIFNSLTGFIYFYKFSLFSAIYSFCFLIFFFLNNFYFIDSVFFFVKILAYISAIWLISALSINYVVFSMLLFRFETVKKSLINIKIKNFVWSYIKLITSLPVLIILYEFLISKPVFILNYIGFNFNLIINMLIGEYLEYIKNIRQFCFKFYTNSDNIFYFYIESFFDLQFVKITNSILGSSSISIEKFSNSNLYLLNLDTTELIFTFVFIAKYISALAILAVILLLIPNLLAEEILDIEKNSAYECGFEPFFINSAGIEVHFLIVAFIFLIFDMELLFLTMKIVNSGCLGNLGLTILGLYTLTIFLMLAVEFLNGALSWPTWFSFIWQDDSVFVLEMKNYKYSYRYTPRNLK